MIFADAQLARRLEAAEAANARGCSVRDGAAVLEIAGGIAIFMGVDSPLSQAVGIGLNGPVSPSEIGQMESFFRSRGARVSIDLCPLAEPGLLPVLADRGYRPTEFNNVLVKSLAGAPAVLTPRVRRAATEEQERWSHTVGWGFFDRPELTGAEMDIGRSVFAMPGRAVLPGRDRLRRPGWRSGRRDPQRARHLVCRQHHPRLPPLRPPPRTDRRPTERSHRARVRCRHRCHPPGERLSAQLRADGLRGCLHEDHARGLRNF